MRRALLLVLAVAACHPNLPPQTDCTPMEYRCVGDRPYVCSMSRRLEPAGDTTCAAAGGVCVVHNGGPAHCATAADGGAP